MHQFDVVNLLNGVLERFRNGDEGFLNGLLAIVNDDLDFREGDFREERGLHPDEGEEAAHENHDHQEGDAVSMIDVEVLQSVN